MSHHLWLCLCLCITTAACTHTCTHTHTHTPAHTRIHGHERHATFGHWPHLTTFSPRLCPTTFGHRPTPTTFTHRLCPKVLGVVVHWVSSKRPLGTRFASWRDVQVLLLLRDLSEMGCKDVAHIAQHALPPQSLSGACNCPCPCSRLASHPFA